MGNTAKIILNDARQHKDELHLDLYYPDLHESDVKKIVVGLMDVRSADSIRISYDKERDGWRIDQASIFAWEISDSVCDPDWKEVAFIRAWGREIDSKFLSGR